MKPTWRTFLGLWIRGFLVVCLLAGVEGALLWSSGFEYKPKHSLTHAWIPSNSVSIDADGKWAAARMYSRQNDSAGRTAADLILLDLQTPTVRMLRADIDPVCIALSPDAKWLALTLESGELMTIEEPTVGNHLISIFQPNEQLHRLLFSPNGIYLAGLGSSCHYLWSWPSGQLLWHQRHDQNYRGILKFSPDSSQLICMNENGDALSLGLPDGVIESIRSFDGRPCTDAIWCDTAQDWQIVVQQYKKFRIYNADDSLNAESWSISNSDPTAAFAISPKRLAIVEQSEPGGHQIAIYENGNCRHVAQFNCGQHRQLGLTFPGDDQLITWSQNGDVRAWNLANNSEDWAINLLDFAGYSK